MNTKAIFSTASEWVSGLVGIFTGFVSLGIVTEIVFGSGAFGVDIIANITALVGTFVSGGFTGFLALLVIVGLWKD